MLMNFAKTIETVGIFSKLRYDVNVYIFVML